MPLPPWFKPGTKHEDIAAAEGNPEKLDMMTDEKIFHDTMMLGAKGHGAKGHGAPRTSTNPKDCGCGVKMHYGRPYIPQHPFLSR